MRGVPWVRGILLVVSCMAFAGLTRPTAYAADATPPTGTIVINSNQGATDTPNVMLALTWDDGAGGSDVTGMRFSDDGTHWTVWQPPEAAFPYTLPTGDGYKTVRAQYRDGANNRSVTFSDYILLDTTPPTGTIVINDSRGATNTANVWLKLAWSDGSGSGVAGMRFSDDGAHWTDWAPPAATLPYTLPAGEGRKTVRVQFLDRTNNRSEVFSDYILLDTVAPAGSFIINTGAAVTSTRAVALGVTCTDGAGAGVTRMRFSDDGAHWTAWLPFQDPGEHTLPGQLGYKTVRAQYLDGAGNRSDLYSDYIKLVAPVVETVAVSAGRFTMGTCGAGDDAAYGFADEYPSHQVTLAAYRIGKCAVTNQQYCDVLNWALAQGYLKDSGGAAWAGTGDLCAGDNLEVILKPADGYSNIQYSGGVFSPRTRTGLPDTTFYSTAIHPVVDVSWYGAAAYCNWLSQLQGLTPCYDMTAADWPLTAAPPTPGGYRLPTEAEWERAAAWDGAKHWIYGFTGDTLGAAADRCNFRPGGVSINPLGLTGYALTAPVGWFDGMNVSPNGGVATLNGRSPVGCFDMSGNVWQWCGDWYGGYASAAQTNPTGPATGAIRVHRGGSWYDSDVFCRTADRGGDVPTSAFGSGGFRIAKS